MTRELLQKAYVALDGQWWAQNLCRQIDNALAAPQPEPYGHITTHAVTGQQFFYRYPSPPYLDTAKECIAVYAAPPAAPADMVMVPRKELGGGISLLHQAMVGACDCLTKTHEAKYHAENCFYRKLSAQCDKLEATLAAAPAPAVPRSDEFACPYCFDQGAAPAVREPIIDEMDAVASRYAHKLALDLECVLSDYNGKWWDTAMQTIGEYRMAMNRIHERESPTHMGEPVLPKHGIGGGGK